MARREGDRQQSSRTEDQMSRLDEQINSPTHNGGTRDTEAENYDEEQSNGRATPYKKPGGEGDNNMKQEDGTIVRGKRKNTRKETASRMMERQEWPTEGNYSTGYQE